MRNQLRLAASLALALALAIFPAHARSGLGGSFGSRGSRTYSAPAYTNTAPSYAAPMQRSLTQPTPSYAPGYNPGFAAPAFSGRSAFTSGLLGGLIGAGIGGMLFGHGFFGGLSGGMGFLGLLLQLGLLFLVGRWLLRRIMGTPALAGGPARSPASIFQRQASAGPMSAGARRRPANPPLALQRADFAAFDQTLQAIQAAWSRADINTLRTLTTPEMLSYFAEQLAGLSSRGLRNIVSNVHLQQGDLSEAWSESGRDYATVAMRFTMNDVTLDGAGHVVDGSASEVTTATELWTFLRVPQGRWILSAIQQGH